MSHSETIFIEQVCLSALRVHGVIFKVPALISQLLYFFLAAVFPLLV